MICLYIMTVIEKILLLSPQMGTVFYKQKKNQMNINSFIYINPQKGWKIHDLYFQGFIIVNRYLILFHLTMIIVNSKINQKW